MIVKRINLHTPILLATQDLDTDNIHEDAKRVKAMLLFFKRPLDYSFSKLCAAASVLPA